jgi:hypothetical protein
MAGGIRNRRRRHRQRRQRQWWQSPATALDDKEEQSVAAWLKLECGRFRSGAAWWWTMGTSACGGLPQQRIGGVFFSRGKRIGEVLVSWQRRDWKLPETNYLLLHSGVIHSSPRSEATARCGPTANPRDPGRGIWSIRNPTVDRYHIHLNQWLVSILDATMREKGTTDSNIQNSHTI